MQLEVVTKGIQDTPWIIDESTCPAPVGARAVRATPHIRAVGFIAKPENVNDLTLSMKGPLMTQLRQIPGFTGALILHSQKEWRSAMVMTFWQTELQATNTHWEQFSSIRKLIFPFVDVCTKVQTFQGAFPDQTNGSLR